MKLTGALLLRIGAALLVQLFAAPAHAETKALLIGSDYTKAAETGLQLMNPVADIGLVGAAMKRTSIDEVTLVTDPDADEWRSAMTNFVETLNGDDIALLYVAGHGFQVDGVNYFLTSDATSLIALNPLIKQMTDRAKGAIVIVDACRENPISAYDSDEDIAVVELSGLSRGLQPITHFDLAQAGRGLSQIGDLRGMSAVVFFSTEPGNIAQDGATPGKGSPFAKVFARQIRRRQSLDETFRRTAVEVNKQTEGRQSPWRQGDLPFNVFIAGMRALPIP